MKRSLAALGVMAALFLQACSGHSTLPSTPGAPAAPDAAPAASSALLPQERPHTANTFSGFADGVAYAQQTTHLSGKTTTTVAGPSANAPLTCAAQTSSDRVSLPRLTSPYVSSKSSVTSQYDASWDNSGNSTVTTTATLNMVNVLKGLITADRVVGVASSTGSPGSATSNADGTSFTNLVVQGNPVSNPAPNTKITLTGYGYVVLNEQQGPVDNKQLSNGGTQTSMLVHAMRVVVNVPGNAQNVPVNTTIIVGNAYSSFLVPPAPYQANPTAYGLLAIGVKNDINNVAGPYNIAAVSCNAYSDSHSLASVKAPVGTLSTLFDKANANTQTDTTGVKAYSKIGTAKLLGGLIQTQDLIVISQAKRSGSTFAQVGGITFTKLVIDGKTIGPKVAPNTRIKLPGLGYAMVNEQNLLAQNNGNSAEVNAVHVYVTKANTHNLAVGGQIVLGHARAQISGL